MSLRKQGGGRRGALAAAVVTALLAVIGAALIATGLLYSSGPPEASPGSLSIAERSTSEALRPTPAGPTESPAARATTNADPAGPDLGRVLPGSRPIALNIPNIDVHSTHIVGLGLAKDGSLEVPHDPSAPGWFTPGPSPGQFGPAVIAGHVDSDNGPAVFYRLGELRRGDHVTVTRQDRTTAVFVIDRVHSYQKSRFPTRAVYGNSTNRAELRLITCGGEYDDELGYLGNTVVFAHLTGKR